MKKIFPIMLLSMVFHLTVYAQEPEAVQQQENSSTGILVGLNMSRFFDNFLNLSNGEIVEDNASTLFIKTNGNTRFRAGIDVQFSNEKDDSDVQVSSNAIGLKLGFEIPKRLAPKWSAYAGSDFIVNYSRIEQSVNDPFFGGSSSAELTNNTFGAEMVTGVDFKLSNRVFLTTEAYLLVSSTSIENKVGTSSSKDNSFNFRIIAPSSLYLIVNL